MPQLEILWKSARIKSGLEGIGPGGVPPIFSEKNICWFKVGVPLKELDTGFRRIFCIFHSVFPLCTDSADSELCVTAKEGPLNIQFSHPVSSGAWKPEAEMVDIEMALPVPSLGKSQSCLCHKIKKHLAVAVREDLFSPPNKGVSHHFLKLCLYLFFLSLIAPFQLISDFSLLTPGAALLHSRPALCDLSPVSPKVGGREQRRESKRENKTGTFLSGQSPADPRITLCWELGGLRTTLEAC